LRQVANIFVDSHGLVVASAAPALDSSVAGAGLLNLQTDVTVAGSETAAVDALQTGEKVQTGPATAPYR
jgi:hypothetical protein